MNGIVYDKKGVAYSKDDYDVANTDRPNKLIDYPKNIPEGMKTFIIDVDIDGKALERAYNILFNISGGFYRAVGSAIKRAGKHGLTVGFRIIKDNYTLSQGNAQKYTKVHYGWDEDSFSIMYSGYAIPLIAFENQFGSDGRIKTRVKRKSTYEILNKAFVARMNERWDNSDLRNYIGRKTGHLGIYERVGISRLPIEEKFGPAVPQMLYANPDVSDAMQEEISNEFDKRIEHEITRVLNGWGM